jgi:poly-gamma-glutamate synthesis protein (capsule biosynthesis protein)
MKGEVESFHKILVISVKYQKMNRRQITLMAVGDIMLGEHPLYLGRGVGTMVRKRGPYFPFRHVANTLKEADIVFGNLECSLSCGQSPRWRAVFSGLPRSANGLRSAGFSILSLANNHIMEHGTEAAMDTMEILDSYRILCVGIGADEYSIRNPVILQLSNFRLAFLAYSVPPPMSSAPMPKPQDLYAKGDLAHIKRDIATCAREGADTIIMSLHWGYEFVDSPSPLQVKLAHELVECGVNMIIGHHPHVLQAVEFYEGAVIAYSLGNFVFDIHRGSRTRESVILKCSVSKTKIGDVDFIPIFINQHFQPEVLSGCEADQILDKLYSLQLPKGDLDREEVQHNYQVSAQRIQRPSRRWVWTFILKNVGSFSLWTLVFVISQRLRRVIKSLIRIGRKLDRTLLMR